MLRPIVQCERESPICDKPFVVSMEGKYLPGCRLSRVGVVGHMASIDHTDTYTRTNVEGTTTHKKKNTKNIMII